MITIVIEGPAKSGKSHLIALIGKYMRNLGCDVTIQSEETHNASKLSKSEEELLEHLANTKITIKEMQTSS